MLPRKQQKKMANSRVIAMVLPPVYGREDRLPIREKILTQVEIDL